MLTLKKEGTINFNKSGSGSVSGRLTIPKDFLQLLEITAQDRNVIIRFEDGKLIIEKDNNLPL
jgi:hypothetical protein